MRTVAAAATPIERLQSARRAPKSTGQTGRKLVFSAPQIRKKFEARSILSVNHFVAVPVEFLFYPNPQLMLSLCLTVEKIIVRTAVRVGVFVADNIVRVFKRFCLSSVANA